MNLKNKDTMKKLIRICIYFILFFALYQLILIIGEKVREVYFIGISLYLIAASVLFCVFYAKNGYKLSPAPTKKSDLPDDWSDEEKSAYLAEEEKKKKQARKILMVFLPMIVTVLVNYVTLYAYDIFQRLFS